MQNLTTYKFFRKELNQWVTTEPEEWQWEATYIDGTVLKQFDDTGIFHQIGEIDQRILHVFRMVSPLHPQVYTMLFNPDHMRLIHKYRYVVSDFMSQDRVKTKMFIFGYKSLSNGVPTYSYTVILPSGESIMTNDIDNISIE